MAADRSVHHYVGYGLDKGLLQLHGNRFQGKGPHEHFEQFQVGNVKHLFVTMPDQDNFTKTVVDSCLDVSADPYSNRLRLTMVKHISKNANIPPEYKLKARAFATVRLSDLSRAVYLPNGIREETGIVALIPLQL